MHPLSKNSRHSLLYISHTPASTYVNVHELCTITNLNTGHCSICRRSAVDMKRKPFALSIHLRVANVLLTQLNFSAGSCQYWLLQFQDAVFETSSSPTNFARSIGYHPFEKFLCSSKISLLPLAPLFSFILLLSLVPRDCAL
jgi:hypothetical protein